MSFRFLIALMAVSVLVAACSGSSAEETERQTGTEQSIVEVFGEAEPVTDTLPEQIVVPGEGFVEIQVNMPAGYKLNYLAPFTLRLSANSESFLPRGQESAR